MKRIIMILDSVSVILLIIAVIFRDSYNWPAAAVLIAFLFIWQFVENGLLKKRFKVENAPAYPAGLWVPMLGFAIVLLTAAVDRFFANEFIISQWFGAGLFLIGFVLRIWAFLSIKHEYLKEPSPDQVYIKKGPYFIIKHPSNWGLFLMGLGTAVSVSSYFGVIACVCIILPGVIYANYCEKMSRRMTNTGVVNE